MIFCTITIQSLQAYFELHITLNNTFPSAPLWMNGKDLKVDEFKWSAGLYIRDKYLKYKISDHLKSSIVIVFYSSPRVIKSSNTTSKSKKQLVVYFSTNF